MAEFYPGTRYILQAFYASTADYAFEKHATREQADASRRFHNAAGANVQISETRWEERTTTAGWYPATAGRAQA